MHLKNKDFECFERDLELNGCVRHSSRSSYQPLLLDMKDAGKRERRIFIEVLNTLTSCFWKYLVVCVESECGWVI